MERDSRIRGGICSWGDRGGDAHREGMGSCWWVDVSLDNCKCVRGKLLIVAARTLYTFMRLKLSKLRQVVSRTVKVMLHSRNSPFQHLQPTLLLLTAFRTDLTTHTNPLSDAFALHPCSSKYRMLSSSIHSPPLISTRSQMVCPERVHPWHRLQDRGASVRPTMARDIRCSRTIVRERGRRR
jgi:hypothetical protein